MCAPPQAQAPSKSVFCFGLSASSCRRTRSRLHDEASLTHDSLLTSTLGSLSLALPGIARSGHRCSKKRQQNQTWPPRPIEKVTQRSAILTRPMLNPNSFSSPYCCSCPVSSQICLVLWASVGCLARTCSPHTAQPSRVPRSRQQCKGMSSKARPDTKSGKRNGHLSACLGTQDVDRWWQHFTAQICPKGHANRCIFFRSPEGERCRLTELPGWENSRPPAEEGGGRKPTAAGKATSPPNATTRHLNNVSPFFLLQSRQVPRGATEEEPSSPRAM